MKKLLFLLPILPFLFYFQSIPKDDVAEKLQSGPMLGYAEMREVLLWVQTNSPAEVMFKYWEKGKDDPYYLTKTYSTKKAEAYTAHLIADEVLPGKRYEYQLYIDNQPIELEQKTEFQSLPLWQFRSDPPSFKLAVGSCLYVNDENFDRPNTPYGGEYKILETIHNNSPDLMVWLGDNTYYREADVNTWTGIIYRNTHTRSIPELQNLLASTHNYALWDDHDYGPNDHNSSFTHKENTLKAFRLFWANPSYGFNNEKCVTSKFDWADVEFFTLDNRWFRSANNRTTGEGAYFGQKQIDWLINALKASNANFKIIASGGQIINSAKKYENYACYQQERKTFLKLLEKEKIEGLFFLSGDRHHAELSKMDRRGAYPLYDLTTSPLTSGTHAKRDEGNKFQVEGTLTDVRNFAIIEFDGSFEERVMNLKLLDKTNNVLWERQIKHSELKY